MRTLKDIEQNFTKKEKEELAEIVRRIKATCQVRMIILFGSHARGEQLDKTNGLVGKKSDYDILVIPISGTKNLQKKVRLLLKNLFHDIDKTVNCLVETIDGLNNLLREGQYFFTEIKDEGIYLYKTGKIELIEAETLSPNREIEIAEWYFEEWFGQSKVSYRNYELNFKEYFNTKNIRFLRMSAFHLQQCAESCYKCIELVLTRYCPHEHLLVFLKQRVIQLNVSVQTPFPCETDEQKKDFDHLDYAYLGARYDKEYSVTLEQLKYWQKENEKLMDITNEICTSHIGKLKNI